MAIDSKNSNFKGPSLPQHKFKVDSIPEDKIIPHNYQSLIRIAKNQIEHYINQIVYHPDKRSLYIKKINEIINNEFSQGRGFIKNEEK